MLKIAITGNISSGKSQVEKILYSRFPVYDADKLAHEVLDELTDFYGYDVFTNGKIDRNKLGKLVFKNSNLRKKLEDIIHPKVKNKILDIFSTNEKIVFISIPLLFETGFDKLFDKIIFVQIDKNIQLERLMRRNKLTKEEALLRIESQGNQEDKIQKSDFIIDNNSDLKHLEEQVLVLIRKLSSLI